MGATVSRNDVQAGGRDVCHWTVAFYGKPRNLIEGLVFSPGFRHCIAFAWLDTDRWLEVNPKLHRLEMRILTGPQYSRRLTALTRIGAHVVKAAGRGGIRRTPRVATCAGSLAHLLGVRGALRPEELYRALCGEQPELPSDVVARPRNPHAPK